MDRQNIAITYRTCGAGQLIPAVLGGAQPWFAGLEEHLPDILVGGTIELLKGLVLGWVELPQSAGSVLARENQAN